MAEKSEILLEWKEGGRVALVTIDRPQRRNACDFAAWTDLRDIFRRLAEGTRPQLVVLTGAQGHFCAGDDIVAFRAVLDDTAAAAVYRARIQECYAAVQGLPVPVVAAIGGACVGGGCSLALCCDFRVGRPDARIGVPTAKLGLVYPTVQLVRLASLIGVARARRWVYGGELVGCSDALEAGYLDVACGDDVVAAAIEFGRPFMDSAPLSIAGSKLQLNAIAAGRLQEASAAIDAISAQADNSADYRNAATAFAQKRRPVFEGR
ncbi:enoyl-CoA hydratase/isomerase family protein [Candidimonas humi]|jgi:enoyl-CoA hydratase/carnithine racemase|uniref:Enoyl-CoA hydratase/isomerase family protein n=1 Tax=Candidimonas humi TaxID=683355 RepID=A0ABV8NXL1_9BURK|nr:enoyl-CoA hydratase/isomerase family protein [Candidimonas humi]MBV6306392.1 enoyl-CoA hydratase/isomerase family protein [Candidimonas humi]